MFGLVEAVAKSIHHAAIMLKTPDELPGCIGAIYGMPAGSAPSLGERNLGWLGSVLGIPLALSLGGLVPIVWAAGLALFVPELRPEFRGYRVRPVPADVESEDADPALRPPRDVWHTSFTERQASGATNSVLGQHSPLRTREDGSPLATDCTMRPW